jgi:hypothetical protein
MRTAMLKYYYNVGTDTWTSQLFTVSGGCPLLCRAAANARHGPGCTHLAAVQMPRA